jgi:Ca2+/Na+ antiporter
MAHHPPSLLRRLQAWRDHHREAGLSAIFALLALIMFVISPLAHLNVISAEITEASRFCLAGLAILILNRNRWVGLFVIVAFAVSLLCSALLRDGAGSHVTFLARTIFTVAFEIGVMVTVAHAAFDRGRISVHRIMGAVMLYLFIGLTFASLYRLAMECFHPAFRGLAPGRGTQSGDLLYFSLSTLTTAGFGDIVPLHPFVRSLANLESVIGQLYPATFLARLVTLHGSSR